MGFRSTFVTDHIDLTWPDWFCNKYEETVYFQGDRSGVIAAKVECDAHVVFGDLHEDIRRVLRELVDEREMAIVLVYLHECGGITRCKISKSDIKWHEPSEWVRTEGVTHDHCYGCTEAREVS